jgi:hypothetical protein
MTYDSRRKRIVLYGGAAATLSSETWEWNGSAWEVVANGPPARVEHAMAFDPVRGYAVMFGGTNDLGNFLADTWIYDGQSWQAGPAAPAGMVARAGHAMAFDPIAQRIVLAGGQVSFSPFSTTGDVWEWNGSTWVAAGQLPRVIADHAMATDADRGLILLQPDSTNQVSQTVLRRDGSSWEVYPRPTAVPLGRTSSAVALDTRRRRAIMFGGSIAANITTDETWIWKRDWTQTSQLIHPPRRTRASLAYDEANDNMILFGGLDEATFTRLGDTWKWNAATEIWELLPNLTPTPAPRSNHAMVYDTARREIVLIGGIAIDGESVWLWNGSAWAQTTSLPAALANRSDLAAAYDPLRRTVLVFGGRNSSGTQNDLWEWNGDNQSFTLHKPLISPSPRADAALAWDPAARRLVLFGGIAVTPQGTNLVNESWELEWIGDTPHWHATPRFGTAPLPRASHALVSALEGAGVTAIAGDLAGVRSGAVITLRYDGAVDERCTPGIDADGDGLAYCDDPDCWEVCTPTCMPDESCPATTVGCGSDGVCMGVETCVTCPSDCACPDTCGDFACTGGESLATCPGDC